MSGEQHVDGSETSQTGTLLLVVGASGAGKDTLIHAAKQYFVNHNAVVFPRRLITRTDLIGEDHIPITFSDLKSLEKSQGLFLSWEAHGLYYGIPLCVKSKLENGNLVIINMSRRKISTVKRVWRNTRIIHVRVAPEILVQRLHKRGRETEASIKKRLARQVSLQPSQVDHVIDNNGGLDIAVKQFNLIIKQYLPAS